MTLPDREIASQADVARYVAREIAREARREAGEAPSHKRDSVYLSALKAVCWGLEAGEGEGEGEGSPSHNRKRAPSRVQGASRNLRLRLLTASLPIHAREIASQLSPRDRAREIASPTSIPAPQQPAPLQIGGRETRQAERDPRRRVAP